MIRTAAILFLALALAGCTRFHSRAQGPFAPAKKEPPPPYGSVAPNKPVANQSPLGISSADPALPLPPDEQPLIPPKASGARALPQPTPAETPKTPAGPDPAAKNLAELKALVATANAAWKDVTTYETTLTRRELNPKGHLNSEVLVFQFRREPMSVYTHNIGGHGKGREMIYSPTKHDDKMHVKLGEGDSKIAKAGFLAPPISPDDPQVRAKARYSIRDAGFGRNIGVLGAAVAKLEAGKLPPDVLIYDGLVTRPEFAHPLVGVTHRLRPGDDPLMPDGGTRLYFFDLTRGTPAYAMPVLVIATDAAGREAEYYLFEKVKAVALTDADFNPARLKK